MRTSELSVLVVPVVVLSARSVLVDLSERSQLDKVPIERAHDEPSDIAALSATHLVVPKFDDVVSVSKGESEG